MYMIIYIFTSLNNQVPLSLGGCFNQGLDYEGVQRENANYEDRFLGVIFSPFDYPPEIITFSP